MMVMRRVFLEGEAEGGMNESANIVGCLEDGGGDHFVNGARAEQPTGKE
jgi:hypothetical protein